MSFRWLMAALPLALAEFDKCARPNGVWAGYDQGTGTSHAAAVAYSHGNVYIAGYAMGNLSFHSQHADGSYNDHEGSSSFADEHDDVTIHHATGSFAGGIYDEHKISQHGMDAVIYKISEAGVPVKVFGVDTLPADEIFNDLGADEGVVGVNVSVNGRYGGFGEFYGIDAFDAEVDMVAAGGLFRGKLTFQMTDGSEKLLINTKDPDYATSTAPHLLWGGANGFVTKVDMASGKAVWATDVTTTASRFYLRNVATTAAGHVLATIDERVGSAYKGKVIKFDGASGTVLWEVLYDYVYYLYGAQGDVADETAYVTGTFKNTSGVAPFGTGATLTSSSRGDAIVAALDVSGTAGPVALWTVQIGSGGGSGYSVTASGDYVYVAGTISAAASIGSCSLTAARGGFLVKLDKSDGSCVWAKDAPMARGASAVSDGTNVWAFNTASTKMEYDADHIVYPNGPDRDVFVAKYSASDGAGLWATSIGGTGSDRLGDAAMTSSGPVYVGYKQSETISFGDLTINNLQHKRVEAEAGQVGTSWGPNRGGETAIFSMLINSVDAHPPCISSCPSGEISGTDTTVASGQCYAHSECLADGVFSTFIPCFRCSSASAQKTLQGPVTGDYCYFENECLATGTVRPNYQSRNDPSVCEACNPAVDPFDWSLKPGYFQDRVFANDIEDGTSGYGGPPPNGRLGQANAYGMLFEKESNGCQIMPGMSMPASKSDALVAALVNPTSDAAADVSALASSAISAVRSATSSNQHVEIAWARYLGDQDTCTKAGNACQFSPSALADTMGAAFETAVHYGDSISSVKVQQGLILLQGEVAKSSPSAAFAANLTMDVVAHMLIPYYQGAIQAAHRMDVGPDKVVARSDGAAYWNVINDAIGADFDPDDRAFLTSAFGSAASGDFNYCAVSTRLLQNLPTGSHLQYVNYARAETLDTTLAETVVHVTATDVGTLTENQGKLCTAPSPPPPSSPPPPAGPLAESSSDDGLSDGELIGIIVGASVVGVLVIFLLLSLVSSKFRLAAKPVFTCLEAATPCLATDPMAESKYKTSVAGVKPPGAV